MQRRSNKYKFKQRGNVRTVIKLKIKAETKYKSRWEIEKKTRK